MSFLSAAILPKEGGRLLTTSERKMQMMSLLTRPTILIHELYKLPQTVNDTIPQTNLCALNTASTKHTLRRKIKN